MRLCRYVNGNWNILESSNFYLWISFQCDHLKGGQRSRTLPRTRYFGSSVKSGENADQIALRVADYKGMELNCEWKTNNSQLRDRRVYGSRGVVAEPISQRWA